MGGWAAGQVHGLLDWQMGSCRRLQSGRGYSLLKRVIPMQAEGWMWPSTEAPMLRAAAEGRWQLLGYQCKPRNPKP